MANRYIDLAIGVPRLNGKVRGARAHVLLLLANRADKNGHAWPSARTLADEAGLTERTVRDALLSLEDEGLIVAMERDLGRPTRWHLLLDDDGPQATDLRAVTPENASGVEPDAPRKMLPGTPEIHAADPGNLRSAPRKSTHQTPENASYRTLMNQEGNPKGNPERGTQRGTRLPADWIPSASDAAFARERGLDPDHIAECFRDYWHAKPGAGAAKSDWSATWRNWCRRERPAGSDPRRNPRTSARVDTAAWLAGLGPETDAAPNARVLIDPEGNPQ